MEKVVEAGSSDLAIVDDFYTTIPVDSESNLQFQSDAVATEKKSLASKLKGTVRSIVSTMTGILLAVKLLTVVYECHAQFLFPN